MPNGPAVVVSSYGNPSYTSSSQLVTMSAARSSCDSLGTGDTENSLQCMVFSSNKSIVQPQISALLPLMNLSLC